MSLLSRRSLIVGGGAVVVAGVGGAVAESGRLRRRLGLTPEPSHPIPAGPVGEVVTGSFRSRSMRATTGWSIGYPFGSAPGTALPVLLELHGRGDTHRDAFGGHRLGSFLSAAVRSGVPPFAVVAVDGGNHSYWHQRRDGEDPQAMVLDELLPLLADRGLRINRLALAGWSMGGYGALLLAERLGPSRVAAVAVDSPAIWQRWQDSASGAFDGQADFTAHDVLAGAVKLRGIPVRVTCGTSDPFIPGVRRLLQVLPAAQHDLGAGGHNLAWWQHAAPGQLAFAGGHLSP